MSTFGERLKQAREAGGITLDSIADATNISRRYLEALEKGDLRALPGGAFNKGYIRTYAEFVHADPRPILDAYVAQEMSEGRETPESEQRMLQELSRLVDLQLGKKKSRFSAGSWAALTMTVLVLVSTTIWFFLATTRVDESGLDATPAAPSRLASGLEAPSPPDHAEESPGERPEPGPAAESPERGVGAGAPSDSTGAQGVTATRSIPVSDASPGRAPEPATPRAAERSPPLNDRLAVAEAAVGAGVVKRNLIGQGDRFPEGKRVWFWTLVTGGRGDEIVRHVWMHEAQMVQRTDLPVGGPHWRTYSSYTLPAGSLGRWVVEARAPDNRVLAREEFLCFQPSDSQTPQ